MPAIRIIDCTIFRRAHAPAGAEYHDCTPDEAALLIGTGRAVRIASPAPGPERETAQAVPVVEVPEHRAEATPSFALQAQMGERPDDSHPGEQQPPASFAPAKRARKPRAPRPDQPTA